MALGSTGAHEVWVKLMISHQGPTPLTEIPLAGKRLEEALRTTCNAFQVLFRVQRRRALNDLGLGRCFHPHTATRTHNDPRAQPERAR